jgi:hypothetical protein
MLYNAADNLSAGLERLNNIIEKIPILGGATRAASGVAADGSPLSDGQRATSLASSTIELATLPIGGGPGAGERIIFSGRKITSGVAQELGLARRELGNRIEAIKHAAGLAGNDNVRISNWGNVFRKATGEFLDNVHDVIPKK